MNKSKGYRIKKEFRWSGIHPDGHIYTLQVYIIWWWFSLAEYRSNEEATQVLNGLLKLNT